jgi:hypothetical protein
LNEAPPAQRAGPYLYKLYSCPSSQLCSALFGRGADLGGGRLAVLEEDHRRDAANAIFARCIGIVVDVELGDGHLLAHLVADLSSAGAIMRQGPHHSAQKSTSTGPEALITSWSKEASVTILVAIRIS